MNNLSGWCPRRIENFSLARTFAPTGTSTFTMARHGPSFEVVSLMSRGLVLHRLSGKTAKECKDAATETQLRML
jgi:hypothetical protein